MDMSNEGFKRPRMSAAIRRLSATPALGDEPEIDTRKIWRSIVGRLGKKEYTYDRGLYGNEDDLAEKIAYFFHASVP